MGSHRRPRFTPEEALGSAVRELRRERGLTQEQLAFACERSPHFISDVERAKYSMSVRTLFAVAGALGARPSEVLRRAEALLGL
jgi:transcriptional regulator with XRE-family HTH domain